MKQKKKKSREIYMKLFCLSNIYENNLSSLNSMHIQYCIFIQKNKKKKKMNNTMIIIDKMR